MENKELMEKVRKVKLEKKYTLHDLSKLLDVQVTTLERWLMTNRINRVYAQMVKEKLGI
jgi:hypothetical protein